MIYIILLNWNGWKDTIECLESVFKLEYLLFRIIVCDNQSSDHSVENIKKWAEGTIQCQCTSQDTEIQNCVFPLINKPISYSEYTIDSMYNERSDNGNLILVHTGGNLGFAGGCNVGIKYALAQKDCKYIWLLNNDTVVKSNALSELITFSQIHKKTICGSKLMYYHEPNRSQALGNVLNKFLGTTSFVTHEDQINRIDFLVGASMFIPISVFQRVGLLSEEYFLYYEEADFWQQCQGRYLFACVGNSIVYHKEGASIGANTEKKNSKSFMGDFYGIRNRILFMKKYFPIYMTTVYLGLLVTIFHRIRRHQYNRIKMVIHLILNPDITYEDYKNRYLESLK